MNDIGKVKDVIPTEMTICGRTYDILSFLQGEEKSVVGHTMVERAKEMNAHLGQDDGQHLLDNQQDIPTALRDKVVFAFTDWHHPDDPGRVAVVCWHVGSRRWIQPWYWLALVWFGHDRVLRRK